MGLFGSSSPFDPLMDKACNEQNTAEDWSLILSICDKAKSHPKNGLSSIIKKMQHKVPRVALQALVILDACVSNSGREFQKSVSSQEFINEMRPLVGRSDLVGERIRELIQKWTNDFQNDAELSLIVSFYHYLRASGAHFPVKSDVKKVKNVNPDAVDSQKEADEIAIAIQRSLEAAEKENDAQPKKEVQSLYYSTLQTAPNASSAVKVVALYDFEAVEENELTFKVGDVITLLEESDPNWWEGSINGRTGLFPVNFVTKDFQQNEPANKVQSPKKAENKKVVVTVDENLLDATIYAVEMVDPSVLEDPPEMLENESQCQQMGAIIDARLSEMDQEQLELTQLNQKLLQCLQLYDTLMQQQFPPQQQSYMPPHQMTNHQMSQQMANMNIQENNGQQMYQQGHYPQASAASTPAMMNNTANHHPQYSQPYQMPQQMNQGQINAPRQMSQVQMNQPPHQQMNQPPPQQMNQPVQNQQMMPPNQYYANANSYEPTAPPPTPPVTDPQPRQLPAQNIL